MNTKDILENLSYDFITLRDGISKVGLFKVSQSSSNGCVEFVRLGAYGVYGLHHHKKADEYVIVLSGTGDFIFDNC